MTDEDRVTTPGDDSPGTSSATPDAGAPAATPAAGPAGEAATPGDAAEPSYADAPDDFEVAAPGYDDFETPIPPSQIRYDDDDEPLPLRASSRRRRSSGRPQQRSQRPAASGQRAGAAAARGSRLPSSDTARTRRMIVALVALALIIGALAYAVWSTLYRAEANVPAGRTVTVTVAQGSSGEVVATQLAAKGIVANATMFRIQAQLMGATSDIHPGAYTFTTGSDYETVIRRLQQGPPPIPTVTITFPEGWGIAKVAARVQDKLGIPAAEFTKLALTGAKQFDFAFLKDDPTDSLEGYLFPKTYTFKVGTKAADVIKVLLTQFGIETAGLDYSYAAARGVSPHDALTIASIIEREASVASDRPKVASVIYNRLKIGMRLQLDSTVQYALNGKANLTLADLQTNSPYNTYVHTGVPPGPLCSPGIVAIKAALHPATTKYLYYILTYKDGRQSFATNYAAFLVLKAQFQRGLK
jgi:UPF0755 protein